MIYLKNYKESVKWAQENLPEATVTSFTIRGLNAQQITGLKDYLQNYLQDNGLPEDKDNIHEGYSYPILQEYYEKTKVIPNGYEDDISSLKLLENASEVEWDKDSMVYDPVSDGYYSSPDEMAEDILLRERSDTKHPGYAFATIRQHVELDMDEIIINAEENTEYPSDEEINWIGIDDLEEAIDSFNNTNTETSVYYMVNEDEKIKLPNVEISNESK